MTEIEQALLDNAQARIDKVAALEGDDLSSKDSLTVARSDRDRALIALGRRALASRNTRPSPGADVVELLDRITPEVIDQAAQRLASFEDNSVWPDSWDKLDVLQMRIQAERVLRSGIVALSTLTPPKQTAAAAPTPTALPMPEYRYQTEDHSGTYAQSTPPKPQEAQAGEDDDVKWLKNLSCQTGEDAIYRDRLLARLGGKG